MQMMLQIIIWNKLIDEQSVFFGNTISDQRDQVSMMNTTDNLNFSPEFSFPLSTSCLELLDSH